MEIVGRLINNKNNPTGNYTRAKNRGGKETDGCFLTAAAVSHAAPLLQIFFNFTLIDLKEKIIAKCQK